MKMEDGHLHTDKNADKQKKSVSVFFWDSVYTILLKIGTGTYLHFTFRGFFPLLWPSTVFSYFQRFAIYCNTYWTLCHYRPFSSSCVFIRPLVFNPTSCNVFTGTSQRMDRMDMQDESELKIAYRIYKYIL